MESVSVGVERGMLVIWLCETGGGIGIGKRTGSSDGEGALDSAKFLVGDEGGVGSVANVDLVGLQEAYDVLKKTSTHVRVSFPWTSLQTLRAS